MSVCYSQGGGQVPEPNPYTIKLATLPLPQERLVEAPLHEQIPAGEADRIALRFTADGLGFEGYSLYRLAIALKIHGSAKPLDIGRFVLSAPAGIPGYGDFIPEDNTFLKQFVSGPLKPERLHVTWCLKRNLASLLSILSGPGQRTPELALLDRPVIASGWSSFQDHLPARAAALRLMAHKDPELAAFAASQTGDRAFEEKVRSQASAHLLDLAREQLHGEAQSFYGEQLVRMALSIQSTPQGQELLEKFQRRAGGG
jgi:hypothetical protein